MAAGGYGWVLGEDGGVGCRGPVGVIPSSLVPEAVLSDTSHGQVAGPPAKRLSAWGQTA